MGKNRNTGTPQVCLIQEMDQMLAGMTPQQIVQHIRQPFNPDSKYMLNEPEANGTGFTLSSLDDDDEKVTRIRNLDKEYSPKALADLTTGLASAEPDDATIGTMTDIMVRHSSVKSENDDEPVYMCAECGTSVTGDTPSQRQRSIIRHALSTAFRQVSRP
jgi:hypothetical protein